LAATAAWPQAPPVLPVLPILPVLPVLPIPPVPPEQHEHVSVPHVASGAMQRVRVLAESRRHVGRGEQPAREVVRPGMIGTLDPVGEMPFRLLADSGAAMTADVEQRVNRA
jgi:hypothetical protein